MAEYTLYTNPMSRGQIARWALHEVNADYDTSLVEWDNKSADFIAANPMAKVPTLINHLDGQDKIVTEAPAICHYLAEMHPDVGLLPNTQEKADYFRYLFFAAGPVEHAVISRAMSWDVSADKIMMVGFGNYDMTIDTLDLMMTGREYVCGDRFTMADVYVGSQIDWGLQFGTIPECDSLASYAARLRERDAYKAAKAIDMGLIAEVQA